MARFESCVTPAGALRVRSADNFLSRGLGLLVGAPLTHAEGLFIVPCAAIHTVGMRYSIDVVFLDRAARVVKVCANVRPGRMRFALGARAVLELRAGVAAQQGLVSGVRLPLLAAAMGGKAPAGLSHD